MRLSKDFVKTLLIIFMLSCTSFSYAYEYPVVGEYNANYAKVFSAIKEGRCDNMKDELKALNEAEGVSSNIYLAICYFETSQSDKGFKVLDGMLVNQEYDEVLYISESKMNEADSDPRFIKYRGLAYFNIGAFDNAMTDLELYLSQYMDEDVLFSLVDIYVSLKSFDRASATLEKAPDKNGRYYYRKGRIALRTGKTVTALNNLRMITTQDEKVFPSAKMLIGEICASSKRYICAEREYAAAAATEEYSDTGLNKIEKLKESQKLFTGFLSIGEQYDTNVTSIDANEIPGASEVSSVRNYAVADIKLNFYPSFADTVSIGTMHYKTWNHELHSYDMNMHKLYFLMKHGYDNFEVTLPKISAGITYFNGEKFSTSLSAEGSFTFKTDTWRFTVPVVVTKSEYEGDEGLEEISKDGYKYQASLNIAKTFAQKYTASISGGYAIDDVAGYLKQKRDTTFKASLSARLTKKFTPTLAFNYANYDYDDIDREDEFYSYSLKGMYIVTPNIFIGGGVTYTTTDSNENTYDYSKTVTEMSISYSF